MQIENPVGVMSSHYRKPDQYVEPFYFGDPEKKKTGLWLKGLPKLQPTDMVDPVIVGKSHSPRWHRQTLDLPKEERAKARSKTCPRQNCNYDFPNCDINYNLENNYYHFDSTYPFHRLLLKFVFLYN